eukprot:Lithocolla_globosa_v1_NODE_5329_length_1260_cov_5.456432.p2 type:complete len:104 gc:universal NODE_5329_length_1260_cov_5.456432:536-225(-)
MREIIRWKKQLEILALGWSKGRELFFSSGWSSVLLSTIFARPCCSLVGRPISSCPRVASVQNISHRHHARDNGTGSRKGCKTRKVRPIRPIPSLNAVDQNSVG